MQYKPLFRGWSRSPHGSAENWRAQVWSPGGVLYTVHIEWRIPSCRWRGKGAHPKGPITLTAAAADSDDDNDTTAITGAGNSFSAAGCWSCRVP